VKSWKILKIGILKAFEVEYARRRLEMYLEGRENETATDFFKDRSKRSIRVDKKLDQQKVKRVLFIW